MVGEEIFVARKIIREIIAIALGKEKRLYLGNLSAQCEWGHAKDYTEAMWLVLQQGKPDDFGIVTGMAISVRDFVRMSFAEVGIEIEFSGKAEQERGVIIDRDNDRLQELGLDPEYIKLGETVVKVNPKYFRPVLTEKLELEPRYDLQSIVSEIILADLKMLQDQGII